MTRADKRRQPPRRPVEKDVEEKAVALTHVTLMRTDWQTVADVAKREQARIHRLEWPSEVSEPWRMLGRITERALLTRGGRSITVPVSLTYLRYVVEFLEQGGRRQTSERIRDAIVDAAINAALQRKAG